MPIKMDVVFYLVIALLALICLVQPELAFAADPSSKADKVVGGVHKFLMGKWTVSLVSVGIVISGILTLRGVIPVMFLVTLVLAVFLIYASPTIALWIIGLAR